MNCMSYGSKILHVMLLAQKRIRRCYQILLVLVELLCMMCSGAKQHERSFTMRGARGITPQPDQIVRLPRKIWHSSISRMKRQLQCAEPQAAAPNLTKYCACHAKGMSWSILLSYETSFTRRAATGINLQPHQILRLPRKMNLIIDPHHIWNVIYNARSNLQPHQILRLPCKRNDSIVPAHIWNVICNARSNRNVPPTSPNTAPATPKDCHDWSASHMKRHLQCAEQQASTSNLTKYCACHAKGLSWLICIAYETSFTMRGATGINLQPHQILRLPRKIALRNLREICWKQVKWHFQCATDPSMIRPWSDPGNANRNPPRHSGYFSHSPGADSIENYNVSRSGYHSKFHHMLRLPRNVTHELHQMLRLPRKVHQILRLPRKMNLIIDPHHKWNVIYNARSNLQPHQILRLPRKRNDSIVPAHMSNVICNARSNRNVPPTSPNTAPATPKDCHDWSASHMKRHLQCAEQQASTSNLTKYCACHAKLHSEILEKFAESRWSGISNARPIRAWSDHDPTQETQTATRRATAATFCTRQEQILLKITTFPAPAIIPNFTTCCACHEMWHMNFTKCCACHEKWHMNSTKCLRLPRKVTHELHQMAKSDTKWHMTTTTTTTTSTTTTATATATTTTTTRTTTTRTTTTRTTTTRTTTTRTTTTRTTTTRTTTTRTTTTTTTTTTTRTTTTRTTTTRTTTTRTTTTRTTSARTTTTRTTTTRTTTTRTATTRTTTTRTTTTRTTTTRTTSTTRTATTRTTTTRTTTTRTTAATTTTARTSCQATQKFVYRKFATKLPLINESWFLAADCGGICKIIDW